MHQSIGDRIEVLVHFHQGHLKPLRFRWRNQPYPIDGITTTYQVNLDGVTHTVFAVQSRGNLYQLSYNPRHQTWTLDQVYLPG